MNRFYSFLRRLKKTPGDQESVLDIQLEMHSIFTAAPDAVIVIDQSGHIVKWNPKAEKLFGWAPEEVLHSPLSDTIIPLRYREAHKMGMSRFFATGEGPVLGKTVEIQALHKNGTEIDIALSISPAKIEDKYMFIGFIRDITEKKMLEKELREAHTTLENKVVQRTLELEQKNMELEQFVYVASHDLQEPLRTISGFIALLKKQYHGRLEPASDQYIDFISQSSDRMRVLIKDLLDYSRLGKKSSLRQVDLNELLAEVTADMNWTIRQQQAVITATTLPVIACYPTELKLLFQNLVSNAIKFRNNKVPPQIEIDAVQINGYWKLSFRDNGIGIEKQYQDRIFMIFQRLHTRMEYDGSGIGLAHCRKIAELHGGRIWVESSPGEGSIFYVTLHETTL